MLGNITIFNPMADAVPDRSLTPPQEARTIQSVTATVQTDPEQPPTQVNLQYTFDSNNDPNSQILQINVKDDQDTKYRFTEIT